MYTKFNKENDEAKNYEENSDWFLFVKSILQESLEKFKKSTKLHIIYSYIQHDKLRNKFKALNELMISEETKANIYEEFALFRYKYNYSKLKHLIKFARNMIEEEMIENDKKNKEKTNNQVDVLSVINFQNKFVLFLTAIENAVNFHLEFWRELMEESPDIQKLHGLGTAITTSLEITSILYVKLYEINPTHIRLLETYSSFLRDIVNDEIETPKILEKLNNLFLI